MSKIFGSMAISDIDEFLYLISAPVCTDLIFDPLVLKLQASIYKNTTNTLFKKCSTWKFICFYLKLTNTWLKMASNKNTKKVLLRFFLLNIQIYIYIKPER